MISTTATKDEVKSGALYRLSTWGRGDTSLADKEPSFSKTLARLCQARVPPLAWGGHTSLVDTEPSFSKSWVCVARLPSPPHVGGALGLADAGPSFWRLRLPGGYPSLGDWLTPKNN